MSTDMELPTVEETIAFAKAHNFKFDRCSVGNSSCGCAITILVLMKKPELFNKSNVDYWTEFETMFSDKPYELYVSFDNVSANPDMAYYFCKIKNPFTVFGAKLALAAHAEKLFVWE